MRRSISLSKKENSRTVLEAARGGVLAIENSLKAHARRRI